MEKVSVLVVDDDVDLADSLEEVLSSRGHSVAVAYDGESAVRLFKESHFDIAFVDVQLPGINGTESLMAFRELKPECKVMMMTGFSVQTLLDQAMTNGALGVLEKPVDIRRLLKVAEDARPEGIILLADDDPDFSDSVARTLEDAGFRVLMASDGQQAITLGMEHDLDLMILDLKMPVVDGVEAFKVINARHPQLPTLIVTGYPEEKTDQLRRFETLKLDCMIKPFDPKLMLSNVLMLISAAREA